MYLNAEHIERISHTIVGIGIKGLLICVFTLAVNEIFQTEIFLKT